ncbi:MAG: CcmD family protein [Balneolales bacterium]
MPPCEEGHNNGEEIHAMVFYTLFYLIADTLAAYSEAWQGVQDPEHSNLLMQAMTSNNLIFVVLGVSLIIWFVLIGYLIRLEKKLDRLEKQQSGPKNQGRESG